MERIHPRIVLALMLVCLAGCAGSQKEAAPGVANFAEVSPEVWRGGKPSADGFRWLAARGAKTVVDLQMDDESADLPPGMTYVPIRVSLWRCDKVDVDAVLEAIEKNPKPVFIHCLRGRDRTGLAVAAYRLKQGLTVEKVIAEMETFGTSVWSGAIKDRIRELAARSHVQTAQSP